MRKYCASRPFARPRPLYPSYCMHELLLASSHMPNSTSTRPSQASRSAMRVHSLLPLPASLSSRTYMGWVDDKPSTNKTVAAAAAAAADGVLILLASPSAAPADDEGAAPLVVLCAPVRGGSGWWRGEEACQIS